MVYTWNWLFRNSMAVRKKQLYTNMFAIFIMLCYCMNVVYKTIEKFNCLCIDITCTKEYTLIIKIILVCARIYI